MDKTSIINIKYDDKYQVHEMPAGMPEFHTAYGLWIFSYRKKALTISRSAIKPRYFEFYGLAQVIKGKGWYWAKDKKKENIEVGQCVISTPGFIQDYCGRDDDKYTEDSICFAGPVANQLSRCGIINNGVYNMGKERRLLPIFNLIDDPSYDSQIKANFALQKLLHDIFLNRESNIKDDRHPQINYLIEQIQINPEKWWSSAEMADICNLSESQFRIVFKQKTGMKPKIYIDRFKIQKASEQLCNSEKTISEIAKDLGYLDPYHFSRRFKDLAGLAPEHYRKQFSLA